MVESIQNIKQWNYRIGSFEICKCTKSILLFTCSGSILTIHSPYLRFFLNYHSNFILIFCRNAFDLISKRTTCINRELYFFIQFEIIYHIIKLAVHLLSYCEPKIWNIKRLRQTIRTINYQSIHIS